MADETPSRTATTYGHLYEHYPISFDNGYVLDCQECGAKWPCRDSTHDARMDSLAERLDSDSGSKEHQS